MATVKQSDNRDVEASLEEPLLVEVDATAARETAAQHQNRTVVVTRAPIYRTVTTIVHSPATRSTRPRGCGCCGRFTLCVLITLFVLFGPLGLVIFPGRGPGSCLGDGACQGNTGKISFGSCNGDGACRDNAADIGWGSCNGDGACVGNTGGNVDWGSCNGDGACKNNTASVIQQGSCNGDKSCVENAGKIGKGACNGDGSCHANNQTIDSGSCNNDNACSGGGH